MNQQFAIKYRPQNLNEIIGQGSTVKILKNAILREKLGSAIIFTGIHGTGKTSLARIIAKTINCVNFQKDTMEPCDNCTSCVSILKNQSIDVFEIDAASNTSVDDMRSIIESCKYKPAVSKYKIYIIDEVHMLSKSAFNAILKTLEEPPLHVKFIFATTDIQKVPDTVLSRCLRFDLRKITEYEVFECIKNITEKEQINIDDESLRIIAKQSSGSMRDAISTLSLVSNLEYPIKSEDVKTFLSVVDNNFMINLLESIIDTDLKNAVALIRSAYEKVSSFKELWLSFLEIVHYLMCIKFTIPSIEKVSFSAAEEDLLKKLSMKTSVFDLNNIWQIIIKGIDEMAFSPNQMITSEVIIIRLCYSLKIPDIGKLMEQFPQSFVEMNSFPKQEIKQQIVEKVDAKFDSAKEYTKEDVLKLIENDAIIYGYFQSSCEIDKIENNELYLNETEKIDAKIKTKIEKLLKPLKILWKEKQDFDSGLISEMKNLFTIEKEENL